MPYPDPLTPQELRAVADAIGRVIANPPPWDDDHDDDVPEFRRGGRSSPASDESPSA